MYSISAGVKIPSRAESPVKRAHSLSPPRESFTKQIRRLSSGSRSPYRPEPPNSVVAGAVLSVGHVLGATAGYEKGIRGEDAGKTHTAAWLVRSGGVAAAPAGLRLGRYWQPTHEQESGAKEVVQAIANAEVTVFDQCLENNLSDANVTATADGQNLDDLEITAPSSTDETPASEMPELNFFGYESDDTDDTIIVGGDKKEDGHLKNIIDIEAFGKNENKVYMRALLDTCSASNFIREEKARSTRQRILPYRGKRSFFAASGDVIMPLGEILITFHRFAQSQFEGGKTFQVRFLVVSDVVPFDVILGLHFCIKADVFQHGKFFCPILPGHQTSKEKKEQEAKKAKQKAINEAMKAKAREEEKKRRAQAKAGPSS